MGNYSFNVFLPVVEPAVEPAVEPGEADADAVTDVPAAESEQEAPRKRNRRGGRFIADDPATPENEAWSSE